MYCLTVSRMVLSKDASRVIGCADGLRTAAFPPTVRSVDMQAFCGADVLRSVVLNDGLTRLGGELHIKDQEVWTRSPFQNSAITSVRLPSAMQRVEPGAFENCKRLRNVSLPEGVKYIGVRSFAGTALSELELPRSIVRVDPQAFLNEHLTVRFAAGTDAIPREVLMDCTFGHLFIPASVREIRQDACARSTVSSVVFEAGSCLERIGPETFCGCRISSLSLPDSVKSVEMAAFRDCRDLVCLELSESAALAEIGNNAFRNTALTCFYAPESLRKVGDAAFYGCARLTSTHLNEGLRELGYRNFSETMGPGLIAEAKQRVICRR